MLDNKALGHRVEANYVTDQNEKESYKLTKKTGSSCVYVAGELGRM